MRQIGTLTNETQAERFVDYLKTVDIAAQREPDNDQWLIWIKGENDVELAREKLTEFKANPEASVYLEATQKAEVIRNAEIKKRLETKKNFQQVRTNWSGPLSKRAPIVLGLIVICIVAAVLGGGFGATSQIDRWLMFADFGDEKVLSQPDGFYSVKQGQLWRIVTPIFLHGDILHLIFNLMWLHSLGRQIEPKIGNARFLGLVFATASIPNLLQAWLVGPAFLGISGVVFGLFAFAWIRRRDGYLISQQTMIFVMIWFVLGFTPMMNHAVWAHGGGLAVGAAIAYLPEWLKGARRR